MTAISSAHIEGFLNWRLKQNVAPKTAIVDIKTLNVVFHRAERYAVILKNPVMAVELPKRYRVSGRCSHQGISRVLLEQHRWRARKAAGTRGRGWQAKAAEVTQLQQVRRLEEDGLPVGSSRRVANSLGYTLYYTKRG